MSFKMSSISQHGRGPCRLSALMFIHTRFNIESGEDGRNPKKYGAVAKGFPGQILRADPKTRSSGSLTDGLSFPYFKNCSGLNICGSGCITGSWKAAQMFSMIAVPLGS